MNLQQLNKYVANRLEAIYPKREAHNICDLLFEDVTKLTRAERFLKKESLVTNEQLKIVEIALEELLLHKPIQQVLGYCWFAKNKFFLNENVLIPRPETEELVEKIIKENINKEISIVEIGTGSGCIAIALKKNLPNAYITAVDVSRKAIQIAKKNAQYNNADISFMELDFLDKNCWKCFNNYDIIVSNPPYILESEQSNMYDNVLLHEPHLALFVPDNDGLIFYRHIAQFAKKHLKASGTIWVEINELLGNKTLELFEEYGFMTCIHRDLQGKERMIKAMR